MQPTQTQWEVSNNDKIKQAEINQQRFTDLQLAFSEVAKTANGKYALEFINEICLWDKQSNDITPTKLVYEKARRDVWSILRRLIPAHILSDIEAYKHNKE